MPPATLCLRSPLLLLLLVASCGGGGGGSSSTDQQNAAPPAPSIVYGTTQTSSIDSSQIGTTYNLYIYLPPGYATDTSHTYPIIYGLDGDYRFQAMAGFIDHDQINAILVGIGRFDRRNIDYGLPGAPAYYNFLTLELIPFIESHYRVDTSNRTIAGHSFAGLFVGLASFWDRLNTAHYFRNFIAQDPTFYYQLPDLLSLEQQTYDASNGSFPVTYVMSGATCCNEPEVELMYNKLVSRHYSDLDIHELPAYTSSHEAMFNPSFDASIQIIFK